MRRVDATVRKETGYIASFVLIFSALMQAVFLICLLYTSDAADD